MSRDDFFGPGRILLLLPLIVHTTLLITLMSMLTAAGMYT